MLSFSTFWMTPHDGDVPCMCIQKILRAISKKKLNLQDIHLYLCTGLGSQENAICNAVLFLLEKRTRKDKSNRGQEIITRLNEKH